MKLTCRCSPQPAADAAASSFGGDAGRTEPASADTFLRSPGLVNPSATAILLPVIPAAGASERHFQPARFGRAQSQREAAALVAR